MTTPENAARLDIELALLGHLRATLEQPAMSPEQTRAVHDLAAAYHYMRGAGKR